MTGIGTMARLRHCKLTFATVEEIRTRVAAGEGQTDVAREHGVAACTVNKIVRGHRRTVERTLPSVEEVKENNRRRDAAWRAANIEYVRAGARAGAKRYAKAHPEKMRERDRTRYHDNPARNASVRLRVKVWAAAHPDTVRTWAVLNQQRRRASKAGGSVSAAEWREIRGYFEHRCAYCGTADRKLTMDHVIPLSRGGEHRATNVVPACGPCNSTKHARGPLAMVNRPYHGMAA